MADIIPKEALAYLKNKKLQVGFSYKDVWHEEHASAFTVAKAMQLDVLSDLHTAVIDAMEKGQSFESFKKNLAPLLQEKGWWGKKEMVDPLTGKTVNAQLGSDRRLKTIYRVNMRTAYQRGQYERTMQSDLHPYLMYRIGPSVNHREDHVSWDGLILPKDDPWWDSHFPPNGWGYKCYTRAISEARKKLYEENGIPAAPRIDGTGGGNVSAKTQAPPIKYTTYLNERKGTVEQVPDGVDPAFNWNHGKAGNKAVQQKLDEAKQNYEKAAALKPKKEYLTKKKLEENIAAIDTQMKGVKDKQALADLEAQKAGYQTKLDAKLQAEQKKTLTKQQVKLQAEFDAIPIKTYSGIWKEDVTTADWAEKFSGIQAKKDYFQSKLAAGGLSAEDTAKFGQFIKDLDEFDAEGKHYYEIQAELKKVKGSLTALKKNAIAKGVGASPMRDAFSQARKDAALWAKSTKEADTALRDVCGAVWQQAADTEKTAIYHYTQGSGRFNRPLSGFRKPYQDSGLGWESKYFKGVNNVWIDYEGAGDEIRAMTDLINRSEYDIDVWLQRGCDHNAIESFLGIAQGSLSKMSKKELEQHIGHSGRFHAFLSTAVNKGAGFSNKPVIMNVYAPKGTKMMYAEPFSAFGHGDDLSWNGKSKQTKFGGEAEMIIQRGASYKITKIEKGTDGTLYIDMEVHPENGYDLVQQNPADWKGSKAKFR